jgi:hypothetical protein
MHEAARSEDDACWHRQAAVLFGYAGLEKQHHEEIQAPPADAAISGDARIWSAPDTEMPGG